jgi:(1->4)-alpha-D-glucan 1-alpha-D-glucosylmutase
VISFCRRLYEHDEFLADFEPFADHVAALGERISLAMVVLKLTAPGVPDIYQGDELPYRALVDPDNRRPVDWQLRRRLLDRIAAGDPPDDATLKLWLIWTLLELRRRRPQAFAGEYAPVAAADRVLAFVRGGAVLVAVATRPDGPVETLGKDGGWSKLLGSDRQGCAVWERPDR